MRISTAQTIIPLRTVTCGTGRLMAQILHEDVLSDTPVGDTSADGDCYGSGKVCAECLIDIRSSTVQAVPSIICDGGWSTGCDGFEGSGCGGDSDGDITCERIYPPQGG